MLLEEAKQILNDNGYELIEEGKLGRALGIGALALGSLFGNANADEIKNPPDLKDYTNEEVQEFIQNYEKNITKNNYDGYKIRKLSVVFKYGKYLEIYPTIYVTTVSDDVVRINLPINLEDNGGYTIYLKDGSIEQYFNTGRKNEYVHVSYDDFGKIVKVEDITKKDFISLYEKYYKLYVDLK